MTAIVSVTELSVAYRSGGSGGRDVLVVREVSLDVLPGQTHALVGESGSGKSTVAATLLGHLRHGSRVTGGSVRVGGADVFALPARELRRLRGGTVAMVAQNAGHALTPSMRIGRQIAEAGGDVPVVDLLDQVRLPRPAELARRYPHELSGGQQQRVAIAMAIAARPKVLVLDEPTTGLDVITQRGVLDLIGALRDELGLAAVLVSHDLGVVAHMADEVTVLRSGRVVEAAPTGRLFAAPQDPYTRRLLASVPRLDDEGLALVGVAGEREVRPRAVVSGDAPVAVSARDVTIDYGAARAVDGVSFDVRRGEVLALVGESGSGKSTLAWALAGLRTPSGGTMTHESGAHGAGDLARPAGKRPLSLRRRVQLVFQNADTSLNPRRSVGDAVRRPLRFFGTVGSRAEAVDRARQLISDVRLEPALSERLPAQLSGGQRQRIGIARALAGEPDVLIADEITTALDVSVQADVLRLLDDLRRERELACLFISHDLAVVRGLADRVVVLRHGVVVEEGPTDAVFSAPGHPYTRQLMAAVLEPLPGAGSGVDGVEDWADAAGPDDLWVDRGDGHRVRRWEGVG
ncbi:peptide/nickel transport system ATP-binding protein [Streptomyces umbrinus]|uniref:dipeptide ABC transporter ATP-binding protein n=1 Tax=Streptomyces TaxID=1883 RepID=UPI00167DB7D0|nr:ABC transporter ATP-binding protein [Streptomyces umbrinus]MCR3724103.1 peptide/nickel transport system ATP-binding protein [Streptomyces umbrinus]GHH41382.1 putative oligopeptide ABC transporter, ATP-binding protein [Streptomyces umbrinus]